MNKRSIRPLCVALLLMLALIAPAQAQNEPSAITLTVRAGFGSSYRAGEWFPVVVDIANDGPDMRGELEWEFPGQRSEQPFRYPVDLPRGSRKRVLMHAFSRGFARSGEVRLFVGDVVVHEATVSLEPIDADRFVIGVVSSDPTLLNSLETLSVAGANGTVVRHMDPDFIPEQALALRSLNVLFLHDLDSSQLTPGQQSALRLWTGLGGQLIVSGGTTGQRAAAGIADLLPAELSGGISAGDISALLQIGQEALPSGATQAPLSGLSPRAGARDMTGGANLIYSAPLGVGSTTVAAFDLSLLRGWSGEPQLWNQVITGVPLFEPGFGSRTNQTSLLQSVLQIPGLGLPATSTLLIFMLVYVMVIGPANYLVLRRLKRLEWAWLTVPLIVAGFAGGLYLVGFGLRGSQSQLTQVTIVQASEGQPQGLATGFVALFSPRRANYTVGFPAQTLIHETRSFDDLVSGTSPVTIGDSSVELRDLLVDIASVRTLVAEASIDIAVPVEGQVAADGGAARGAIRNSSGEALEDVLIVRGGSYLDLGTLAPGASAAFDFSNASRNFPWGVALSEEGIFNRKTLINSLFNGEATLYSSGSGPLGDSGLYVLAWRGQPSLPIQIDGRDQAQQGYTLYVIKLR